MIEYDEEANTVRKNIFSHPLGEIWQVAASNNDTRIFSTCYNEISELSSHVPCLIAHSRSVCWHQMVYFAASDNKADMRACLWKIPNDDMDQELEDDVNVRDLEKVATLGGSEHGDMK